jgi:hypothetical protein
MMPFAKRRGRLSRMSQDENKSRYPKKRLKAFRGRGAVYSWLRAHQRVLKGKSPDSARSECFLP